MKNNLEELLNKIKCVWKFVAEDDVYKGLNNIPFTTFNRDNDCFECKGYDVSCQHYITNSGETDIGDICRGKFKTTYGDLDMPYCFGVNAPCKYKTKYYSVGQHLKCNVCNYIGDEE